MSASTAVSLPGTVAPAGAGQRARTVAILFLFMMLHQADKLIIGPLTTPIMDDFGIDEARMGAIMTGAIVVGAIFYPVWGYLYDRYARPKVLALAAFIWGSTTWLGAVATTYGTFMVTRASTGIDDASYPGIYSLVSDYFGPTRRGRVIGFLQLSMIIGPMVGMGLATPLRASLGWRGVFYITGGLGLVAAILILLGVRDVPRGQTEPELAGQAQTELYRFSWQTAREVLRRPTLVMLFVQQFIYVFPFMALNYWYFRYMEAERHFSPDRVVLTMSVFALAAAMGNVAAGYLGDVCFRRTPRGRMLVAIGGVVLLVGFFTSALRVPNDEFVLFLVLQTVGSFFTPFVYPNAMSTLQDVVAPEVRSTAHAMMGVAEMGGSALAPLVVGVIAAGSTLQRALLSVTTVGWLAGLLLLFGVLYVVPRDVAAMRRLMRERSAHSQPAHTG